MILHSVKGVILSSILTLLGCLFLNAVNEHNGHHKVYHKLNIGACNDMQCGARKCL
jgi:hypothetical protein